MKPQTPINTPNLLNALQQTLRHNLTSHGLILIDPNLISASIQTIQRYIPQRTLVAAAFGLSDAHWENGNLTKIAGITHWTVAVEWGEPTPPELDYIAKLQILICEIIARWKRTGQRPPHPPSHIAAMYLVKGLDCDWATGEFKPKERK